ncbi:lysine--tRNA ligase, partial [Candidatus Parcubacteria bacterium]|nr:lysine--tRNA ligase [Candidatus Parcubacteria bacterium]
MEKISEKKDRLEKLKKLKDFNINPYPAKSSRTDFIIDVLNNFIEFEKKKKNICIAGRLRSLRSHGNLTFANLQDASEKIQIAFSKKEIGAENYKILAKLIDVGDFIEVNGVCFKTRRGEQSVMIKGWKILTKALMPLPDKWSGLKDEEEKFRKRYL